MASAQGLSMPQVNYNVDDGGIRTGQGFGDKVAKFMGEYDQEQRYQNALTADNRRFEAELQNWFDSTAVQRRVADIKAAGLNPWLALQSGGIGANGSMNVDSGSSAKQSANKKSGSTGIIMILLATAKLLASL